MRQSEELEAKLHTLTDGLRIAFNVWTAEPMGMPGNRIKLGQYGQEIVERKEECEKIASVLDMSMRLAQQHNFFHWSLEFPHIFHRDNPGFDVVTGNPPWDEITIEELRFYLLRDPGLRGLIDLNDRRKRIAELDRQHPDYRIEFEAEKKRLATVRRFFLQSKDYELQGKAMQIYTSSSVSDTLIW